MSGTSSNCSVSITQAAVEALEPVTRLIPSMRFGDAFQTDIARDSVQGCPKANGAVTLHTVVGLILMPRGYGAVVRSFDQYVVVEEP